ncbi:MAG: hypothetical protein ACP5UH_02615 [Candidatus Micrarchaeia archaeon]
MQHEFLEDLKERVFIVILSMIDPDESHERWLERQKRLHVEKGSKAGDAAHKKGE